MSKAALGRLRPESAGDETGKERQATGKHTAQGDEGPVVRGGVPAGGAARFSRRRLDQEERGDDRAGRDHPGGPGAESAETRPPRMPP